MPGLSFFIRRFISLLSPLKKSKMSKTWLKIIMIRVKQIVEEGIHFKFQSIKQKDSHLLDHKFQSQMYPNKIVSKHVQ